MESDNTSPSLLLTVLPKELRLSIYTLVIAAGNTVHISSSPTEIREAPQPNRCVYALCNHPDSDQDVYKLSKNSLDAIPDWEDVVFTKDQTYIRHHSKRHDRCLRLLNSSYWQLWDVSLYQNLAPYDWSSTHRQPPSPTAEQSPSSSGTRWSRRREQCPRGCMPETEYSQPCVHSVALRKKFGQWTIKTMREQHPKNFFHGLSSLLLVCKQIYQEAREIVFEVNTFSFSSGSRNAYQETKALFDWRRSIGQFQKSPFTTWQRNAIRSIHLSIEYYAYQGYKGLLPTQVVAVTRMFPGLACLVLNIDLCTNPTHDDPAGAFIRCISKTRVKDGTCSSSERDSIVAQARVLMHHDNPSNWVSRIWRRKQAQRIEKFLTTPPSTHTEEFLHPTHLGADASADPDGVDTEAENLERKLETLRLPNVGPGHERARMIHVLRAPMWALRDREDGQGRVWEWLGGDDHLPEPSWV